MVSDVTLRIGLYAPTWPGADRVTPRWAGIRALAVDAEALGVDTLWVADEPGFWECWTVLTALAASTTRVEIGPLVVCTRYRNPALLATMVRALDETSAGRLVLGPGRRVRTERPPLAGVRLGRGVARGPLRGGGRDRLDPAAHRAR